ncbi:FhaA domain-containing protein [Kytococcus sp. Marseille-QA3725]
MGLLDRFESGTERMFTAPFARLFKREELQPVEIGAAVRKAMDSRAAVVNRHRTIVPNVFTIELSDDDFDRLIAYDETITDALIADAQEYVTEQRYTPGGPLQIELVADPELQTGIYKLHHATVRNPATLDERGDIDAWGASHERFDDVIDRHTSGHRIPADAEYLGEVDEEAIAAAVAGTPQEEPQSRREERRRAKEREREARRDQQAQAGGPAAEPLSPAPDDDAVAQERRMAEERRDREHEAVVEQQREEIRRAADDRRAAQDQQDALAPAGPEQRTEAAPVGSPTRSTRAVERPWLELDGARYPLTGETTVLGRDAACDLPIDDPGVSRRHLELRTEGSGGGLRVSLRDLGSTNGTFVGGEQVRNARLADGDAFVMGRTTVTVRLGRAQ